MPVQVFEKTFADQGSAGLAHSIGLLGDERPRADAFGLGELIEKDKVHRATVCDASPALHGIGLVCIKRGGSGGNFAAEASALSLNEFFKS